MGKKGVDIDKGYAWVVLGGAFTIQMIAGMLAFSPGVTNITILEKIENDLDKTSWIGAALFGTFRLLGPVAGVIQTRVGSRITAVSGGLIVLTGMTSAFFCETITGLILTYGLITGFGICLGGNVVGTVASQYFVKRRAIAYGVCISGGAMGLFISGPLTRYLLNEYGIHGTLLLLGAIAFHLSATGFLFNKKGPVVKQERILESNESLEVHKYQDDLKSKVQCEQTGVVDIHQEEDTRPFSDHISNISNATDMMYDEHVRQEEGKSLTRHFKDTYPEGTSFHLTTDTCQNYHNIDDSSTISMTNAITTDPEGHGSKTCKTLQKDETRPLNLSLEKASMETDSKGRVSKLCIHCKDITNIAAFVMYNVSVLLWSLGESACMFHLPNYIQSKGSSLSQAGSLFQAVGVGGLFSRATTGLIASDSSIGYTTLHVGLSGISGTLCLLFPLFSHTFPLQMTFGVLYGMYNQGVNTLMGPITIEMIGLSNISIGYGVVYNSSGFGYFLGPPIASALYRLSGFYDVTFIFTGTCLILSSMTAAFSSTIKKTTIRQ